MTSVVRPPGLVAALVGGVLGAVVGVALAVVVTDQLSVGDLSDLGTALILLFAGLLIGPSVGTAGALALRGHERPLRTGLVVGPFVAGAMLVGVRLLAFVPLPDDSAGLLVLPALALLGVAAIWIARVVTMQ